MASRLLNRRPDEGEDEAAAIRPAVAALAPESVKARTVLELPAGAEWLDTGVDCAAGDRVTLVAAGRMWLSKPLGIGFGPNVALWHKVGDSPIAKALGETTSFVADRAGRLRLTAKPPGEWLDESGRFDPDQSRGGVTGAFTVGVVVWRDDGGLERAAEAPGGPFARERERQAGWVEPPEGWRPLWRLGHGPIYRAAEIDGRPAIACRTHSDVGILRRPVDYPLDPATELRWSWRVRRLPSQLPEDLQPTHDYLSIAAEFENGRDLTYIWSSSLQPETSFHCPLPWWCDRETHFVLRSGPEGLGAWRDEARPLLADYRRAIGGPEPARVVAVWLIAVSAFQGGTGEADYAAISLAGAGEALPLL
jgi:hypothetical protein